MVVSVLFVLVVINDIIFHCSGFVTRIRETRQTPFPLPSLTAGQPWKDSQKQTDRCRQARQASRVPHLILSFVSPHLISRRAAVVMGQVRLLLLLLHRHGAQQL